MGSGLDKNLLTMLLLLPFVEVGDIFLELEFESVFAEAVVSCSWLRYLFTRLELVVEARE